MPLETQHFGTEMDQTKTDLTGLNDIYMEIANEIGIENTLVIFRLFHGTQVSFPNRLFSREHMYKVIISEYDGKNVAQLARKYNYSERSIWRIINSYNMEE